MPLLFWAFGLILSTEKYLKTIKYFTEPKQITGTGIRSYIHLLVIYNVIAPTFNSIALYLVTLSLCILSLLLWVAASAYHFLPTYLVVNFCVEFIGGLGLAVFVFRYFAGLRSLSEKLTRDNDNVNIVVIMSLWKT